jgi:hypothetical protein
VKVKSTMPPYGGEMGYDDMLSAVPIKVGFRHTPGTMALSISWPVAHSHGSLGQSDT